METSDNGRIGEIIKTNVKHTRRVDMSLNCYQEELIPDRNSVFLPSYNHNIWLYELKADEEEEEYEGDEGEEEEG